VGKSTLLNQVVNQRKLAKVSSTPGKTRALNFFLADERFYLVDLPGYGYAKVSKSTRKSWGQLIEDYLVTGKDLIGLLLLLDCRRDPTAEDWQLLQWLADRQTPVLIALTKSDKLNNDQLNRKVNEMEKEFGTSVIASSSKTGLGKHEMAEAIRGLVGEHIAKYKAK